MRVERALRVAPPRFRAAEDVEKAGVAAPKPAAAEPEAPENKKVEHLSTRKRGGA